LLNVEDTPSEGQARLALLANHERWWKHRRAATRARQATLTVDTDKSQMTSAPAPHGL